MKPYHERTEGLIENYQQLTFVNDFIFCKTMSDDPVLCRDLIRICTGIEVGTLTYGNTQQTFKVTKEGHGVRLDVYAEDDQNQAFDLEMENKKRENYGERTVYYLGMMGRHQLKMAESYFQLRDNYVIFIMPFNLFPEIGLHRYTFVSKCAEYPDLQLQDRSTRIFICGNGKKDIEDVPEELIALIKYLETNKVQDDFTRRLDNAVQKAKSNREWEVEFMELCEKYREYLEDGIRIGEANLEEEKKRTEAERQRADTAEQRAKTAEQRAYAAEHELAKLKKDLGL